MKRVWRFIVGGVVVLAASLMIPAAAGAQVRSWSYTFDPNDSTPTFQPPAPLPMITFTASYDNDAGTLTISESGGDPSYYDYWQDDDWVFYPAGYTNAPDSAPSGAVGWQAGGFDQPPGSSYFGPLTVNGISGSLQGTNTVSGNTITATYSSPLLEGLNWVLGDISGDSTGDDNSCVCDLMPDYGAYFVGYLPTIALNFANQTSKLGADISTTLNTPMAGLASLDSDATPTVTSVSGLPPGLGFENVDNGDDTTSPTISGTTTTPGVYRVVITAQATVASGSQTVTDTGGFIWSIPTPTVKLPDSDGATASRGLEVKPYSIIDSGDGSGVIAGTPMHSGSRIDRHFGRIHWTSWSYAKGASGRGDQWIDDCDPDCAGGRFSAFAVKLHAYRPALVGGQWIFSRITMTYTHNRPQYGGHRWPRTETLKVGSSNGYYYVG